MRKFVIAFAVFAVMAAMYVAAAPGSQTAGHGGKQLAALKRQVSALSGKVSGLQRRLKGDEATIATMATTVGRDDSYLTNCLGYVSGVSAYGDGVNHTFGYQFTNNGSDYSNTSALNFDGSAAPGVWVQDVSPSCVTWIPGNEMRRIAAHPYLSGDARKR